MRKSLIAVLAAALLAVALLAGCGGGGGGGGTPPEPENTITGRVVSNQDGNPGVPNVVVAMQGFGSAITDADGYFEIQGTQAGGEIPYFFEVDASQASFIQEDWVEYNGQSYWSNSIQTPIEVLEGSTSNLGTITVHYYNQSDPDSPPPPNPYPGSKNTVIMGRVVNGTTLAGIPNVVVRMGTDPDTSQPVTATTGPNGYFALNFGLDADVSDFYAPGGPYTFSIDTSPAGIVNTTLVSYYGVTYAQGSISLPASQLLDFLSSDPPAIGTITVGETTTPGIRITGRVISDRNGSGVANVQITFGTPAIYAVTNSTGNFVLNLPEGTTVADLYPGPTYTFAIDTSGAGNNFPTTEQVFYKGSYYDQDSIEVPASILNGTSTEMGDIIVHEVIGTAITGRVVEQVGLDVVGIPDVKIIFGNQLPGPIEGYTDANGNFSLDIPAGTTVADLFSPLDQNFAIDRTPAGKDFWFVELEGDPNLYDPSSIPVPVPVLTGASTNIGTLTASSGPPPP